MKRKDGKRVFRTENRAWHYSVKNKRGILEPYSGIFKTRKEAEEWYNKHGKELEQLFNRHLILT